MATNYAKIVKGITKMMKDLETYATKQGDAGVALAEKLAVTEYEESRALKTLEKLTGIFGG